MSVRILIGDCLIRMRELADTSVDSVVCDPPYHLTSIVKRFGAPEAKAVRAGVFNRSARGFMGQQWDGGDVAFQPETWAEVLRVLKPGGHLIAFSGTRTYHRMAIAIEDAGFEIRDQLAWVYGSGFPKSHNQPGGWGTALKPSWEPIALCRKPLNGTVAANMAKWGTGALNIDGCRIETDENLNGGAYAAEGGRKGLAGDQREGAAQGMWQAGKVAGAEFVQPQGRWPANLCHDGSDEVVAGFPESDGQQGDVRGDEPSGVTADIYGKFSGRVPASARNDSGSAARFFYCAKATTEERGEGNNHPTVKPVALMQWLVRLVTPKGGTVLDPFMGSGSTGIAADAEQLNFIGCELSPEYAAIAERRIRDAAGMFAQVDAA